MGRVIAVLMLLVCAVNGFAAVPKAKHITLVYSGNLNGELEPCGCSEESNLGGLRRQASKLDELRKKNPDLFLISSGGLLVSELPSDRIKSEFIVLGLERMGYDAIGVQWRDLAFGPAWVQRSKLPWVSSNWDDTGFAPLLRIQRSGVELAFFSWLDPRAATPMAHPPQAQSNSLSQALALAQSNGALTVLMTTLPRAEAQALVPLDHVDVLLIQSKHEEFGEPQRIGNTLVLEPGSRGMRLGRVDLELDAHGRISASAHKVIPLPKTVPDAPELDAWYQLYSAKLKEDYLKRVEIRKALNAGTSPYVGADACKTCHGPEHDTWSGSKHSHAFEALEGVSKTFDPNCIGCHTVGFEKPGGYIDASVTSNLTGVQCENCHGAGRAHVDSGGKEKIPNADWPKEKICQQCHIGAHSPSFAFDRYWPKIAHGRMSPATNN